MSQNNKKQETLIKRNTLSIQQRLEVIKKLKAGFSIQALADEYLVHRSTISRVRKNKEQILHRDSMLKFYDGNYDKKRFKGIETSLVDQSLYKWFQQCRRMSLPITGALLKQKARFFHEKFYGSTEFKASDGWLHRFKQRHGIKNMVMHREKASADVAASEDFKLKFLNLIKVSTDKEIIEEGRNENSENCTLQFNDESTDEVDVDNSALLDNDIPSVSIAEAYQAINVLKNFYQNNEDEESAIFLPVLQKCHRHILNKFRDN